YLRLLAAGAGVLDLLFHGRPIDPFAIAFERAFPRGNRFVLLAAPHQHIAKMILNDRGLAERTRSFSQRLLRVFELTGLEECPTQAVEIGGVLGLDLERALDQGN